jgi:DUF1680 family protein
MVERVACNCLNAAVDLAGENWFYCNPLKWTGRADGGHPHKTGVRWRTNNCYCCPPNVARTTAKLHNWFYTTSEGGLWVHLYGGNRLATTLADGSEVGLTQETDYPWDGRVRFTIDEAPGHAFVVHLRIPAWTESPTLTVNGQLAPGRVEPGSYAGVERQWQAGDVIELALPMPVRLMEADPKVARLRNMVAVTRGPLVYCLELPLSERGREIWDEGVFLPEDVELTPEHRPDFLGGVTVLNGTAVTHEGRAAFVRQTAGAAPPAAPGWHGELYRPFVPRDLEPPHAGTVEISLIPYYAWANRGLSMMEVWIPLAR